MRCRDSEETREFYEDFLGLPLVHATKIVETKTGNATNTLHIFFRMHDGSYLAFFESPKKSFAFKEQHDFDLIENKFLRQGLSKVMFGLLAEDCLASFTMLLQVILL